MVQPNRPDSQSSSQEAAVSEFLSLFTGDDSSEKAADHDSTDSAAESPTPTSRLSAQPQSTSKQADGDAAAAEGAAKTPADDADEAHNDGVALLQNILVRPELAEYRQRITKLEQDVEGLNQRLDQTASLVDTLLPVLQDLMDRQFETLKSDLREEIVRAMEPISEGIKNIATQVESERTLSIQISGAMSHEDDSRR